MSSTAKNVFVSHVHEDDKGLQKLKDLLAKNGMVIRDASITSEKENQAKSPDYIKNKILGPRIDWAGVFIVYITPSTKQSEWVDWEIEYAHRQGKRIVGIWAYDDNECEIPAALEKYADVVVGWRGEGIVDAINGSNENWEKPDGTPRTLQEIPRYSCK